MVIISIIITILSIFIPGYRKKRERIKNTYKIIWRKSSKLEPEDLFNLTSYKINKFYYPRKYLDKSISENIENNKNLLVIGPPLSGKTRTLYQNLKGLKRNVDIIIPFKKDIDFFYDLIPKHYCFWRKRILLLDDLNIFTNLKDFEILIDAFIKEEIMIIGSCRSNIEVEKLRSRINIDSIFRNNVIEIKKIEIQEALQIISNLELVKVPNTFDGTIGSLILPLDEMSIRYNNLDVKEKVILRVLKLLMIFGLYNERGVFKLDDIKILCGVMGINEPSYVWDDFIKDLKLKEFIRIIGANSIWANQVYLDKILNIEEYGTFFNIANLLLESFKGIPSVLLKCGENIFRYGIFSDRKIDFFDLSIKAFSEALSFYDLNQFPIEFANINDDLGNIHIELFKIKEDINICKKAERHLLDALKVRTKKNFPLDFSRINNNLGVIYSDLFRISKNENREDYFLKSLKSLRLAQNLRKNLNLPIEYSNTQINLGYLFYNYAMFKGGEKNFIIAIRHFKNALETRSIEKFPEQFGKITKSLGVSYSGMADVSKSRIKENLLNTISYFKKSLEVFSIDSFSNYIEINNCIGEAYRKIVTQSASEKDFKNGLDYFNQLLNKISPNEYPEIYSRIKYNIGILFRIFGELKESEEYCLEAVNIQKEALDNLLINRITSSIEAFILFELGTSYYTYSYLSKIDKMENVKKSILYLKKSLEIFKIDNSQINYAITNNNLGYAYYLLAELEDIEQNCINALNCFRIALKVINKNNFPIDYARIQDNIGLTFSLAGSRKNSIRKFYYAKNHYKKALEIRTANDMPLYHGVTQDHLGELYFELSKVENKEENLKKALNRYLIALKMFKKVKDKKHLKYIRNRIINVKKAMRKRLFMHFFNLL